MCSGFIVFNQHYFIQDHEIFNLNKLYVFKDLK